MSKSAAFRPCLLTAALVLLAACEQNPGVHAGVAAPLAKSEGQKPAFESPSGPVVSASVAAVAHAAVPPQASAAPQATVGEPSRLKGLTPVQVREVLGQPGFQRRDAPAEIWQYRGRGCTLDLYIYDLGGGQAVEHWAVRSPSRVNDTECFQQLVDQGHNQPGS